MKEEEDEISAEVRELLTNYRNARHNPYAPCRTDNLSQCLAGLQEELNNLNVKYVFNPFADMAGGVLAPPALACLVNAVYAVLHEHKRAVETIATHADTHRELSRTNEALNRKISQLTGQVRAVEREIREVVAESLRGAERGERGREQLEAAQAQARHLATQLAAARHSSQVASSRADRHIQKMQDRCRDIPPTADRKEKTQQLNNHIRQEAQRQRLHSLRRAVEKLDVGKENIAGNTLERG